MFPFFQKSIDSASSISQYERIFFLLHLRSQQDRISEVPRKQSHPRSPHNGYTPKWLQIFLRQTSKPPQHHPPVGHDASLTLAPTFPAFRSYFDYSFFDPARAKETFRDELEKGSSDDQGNAWFTLGCSATRRPPTSCTCWSKPLSPKAAWPAEATALVLD